MTCPTKGCKHPVKCRGYCQRCYNRLWSKGLMPPLPRQTVEQRFWSKVDIGGADECWLWTAYINPRTGYGQLTIGAADRHEWGQRIVTAPVVACTLAHGPRPTGLEVLHSCDVKACANPAHLRWGTRTENMREAFQRGRWHGNRKMTSA